MCNHKKCLGCGKEYIPKRIDSISCSTYCVVKANNKKRSNSKKIWAKQNKEAVVASKQRWLENNPDKRKESSSSYMKRNRSYYAEYASLRNRHMKHACPIWANKEDIISVYKEAEYFGLEVDHIIPLKHPLVCGLHIWDNLQLLSRRANAKKNNKFSLNEDLIGVIK